MASPNQAEALNNTEALQTLLQSFGPDAAQNVSQEALQRLSDKLSELMGADVVRDAFAYNDQDGQPVPTGSETLLNEEGLPIIDITEPEVAHVRSQIQPSSSSSDPSDSPITTEAPPLIDLSTLSPAERDLRKRERERILDLLEAEEVLEQRSEREKEAQERREALDRKRDDGKTERQRLLELKETHQKMGKALLRSVISKDDDTKKAEIQPSSFSPASSSAVKETAATPNIKKKSVSFASEDPTKVEPSEPSSKTSTDIADWGDVSKGRLRPNPKPLVADVYTRQSEQLMKLQVVERAPGDGSTSFQSISLAENKQPSTSKIQILDSSAGDSDDESDMDSNTLSDDDNVPQNSDTEHSDAESGSLDLDEETDWDFAQHQREIALEYHQKRGKIGKETATALTSHTHEPYEDPSFPELASNKPKSSSSMSQFRANRLASSYAVANTDATSSVPSPLGSSTLPTLLPAGAAQTLQHAVRLGKLDEQKRLVGGDAGDSGSEPDDEVAREILELLQKGEVYNLGPNGEDIYVVPPNTITSGSGDSTKQSTRAQPPRSDPLPPFTPPIEPLPQKPKTSRFKLAKTQSDRLPSPSTSVDLSGSSTPVSNARRSSPKLAMESSVVERAVPQLSTSKRSESPSADYTNVPKPPIFNSMVIESPSFPRSAESQRRPERPPTIMSSHVVESSSRRNDNPTMDEVPKRVSRFRAERM
ncbi:hypothetical protein F5879DRAFT_947488 [Lentinula edodes]|uniref:Glycosyltransferase Family 22 protein n=1 Tax=Lentinula edodes TaxID=5353 RepID=A0A1Q3EI36_LENED|nr:hypothetical protein F5879DRAFT_947488 [Lentinula edodes]KAJ3916813.1 hypothetical protein F5877DRAFT_80533 [Lentinula edodes]GAW06883.1 Glycosyltransferase Family 22 protein [Lentinula edodes]